MVEYAKIDLMFVEREIKQKIKNSLYKGRVILIYGPRRVGKTTISKEILKEEGGTKYFSCDEPDVRLALSNKTSTELINFIGKEKIIVIDEAQRVENIGITLKLLVDNFKDMQIIATGSSSFDLSNKINEPLTGRNIEFHLFPFSLREIEKKIGKLETSRRLPEFLNFGLYPEVFLADSLEEKKGIIKRLAGDQLYKDVLMYQSIRKPQVLDGLLRYLALSVGNEVNNSKIGIQVEISKETTMWYLRLLEQAFIIYKRAPFFTNKLKEISRLSKYNFFDNGLRNALCDTFQMELEGRQDLGYIWENFIISELIKNSYNDGEQEKFFFWRTKNGLEVDLVKVSNNILFAYEIKWSKEKMKNIDHLKDGLSLETPLELINEQNYLDYLLKK